MTPAAPPSAETVWLRMGYTLETTAMLSRGLVWAMAIAARKPAPPPPTSTTSYEGVTGSPQNQVAPDLGLMFVAVLVRENLAVVADHAPRNAAVVVLVLDNPAAAGIAPVIGDLGLIVMIPVVLPIHGPPTRGAFAL